MSQCPAGTESLRITGKDPLLLDDPCVLACVRQGRADVFYVFRDASGAAGRRRHLAQVGPGERVPGMRSGPGDGVILIAGIGEAHLCPERLDDALAADPAGVERDLGNWLAKCSAALADGRKPPRDVGPAAGEGPLRLPAGSSLLVRGAGLCIDQLSGSLRFLDLPLPAPRGPLPLPEGAWLTAVSDTGLTLVALGAVMGNGRSAAGVQEFHRLMALVLENRAQQEAEAERHAYRRQRAADRRRVGDAMQGISGIFPGGQPRAGDQGLPPLLAACRRVAEAAGLAIADDTADPTTGKHPDLDGIARHNHFRTRAVLLSDTWWQRNHGPLLAFTVEGGAPVALIPRGRRGYVCLDPAAGAARAVDRRRAAEIAPLAHMFYRPFPAKALKARDLLAFGIFGCGRDFAGLIAAGTAVGLLGLLGPLATGVVVGTYIPNAARNDILEITAILAATAVAVALFNVVKGIAMVRMEGRMDLSVQAAVWDRLLALPVPFFKQFTAGDLAVRSLGIGAIREILSGATLNALLTLIFTSFNLLFLFVYDWQMAMVAVALTGLGALVTLVAAAFTIYYQKTLFEIQGRISGTLLQFICGIAKLRSTGAEDRAFAVLAQAYVRQGRLNFRAGSVDAALIAFNAAFPVLVSMVIFAWYYWVRPGHLPIAGFVAFTSAYSAFQIALLQVSMVMPQTANVIPLYQRARPIFDTLPECDAARKPPGPLTGAVEISHARFRYSPDGPLILDDVSIRAARGEFIAIVGGSGAGKSTLLRLLLGFETPASGGVFFDQQELKHLDVREVRRQIGVVLQNGKLMSGDIYCNIVGIANLTMEDAWEAARRVGLAEDIAAMPMKMHTIIPAGGGSLSGGQRQRLLIARAIANHPRMLFFDEATSALDNVTQAIVSRSLAELSVTRIVIAHRLSTILHADRIYVMHGGKVVEEGNYDALMTRQGYFYDQARRQIS
jgi:ATP-binding cassette subfamily C protein